MLIKPWQKIPLLHSKETFSSLPKKLYRIQPHAYQSLGAPYGENVSPWLLRTEVVKRLLLAQNLLQVNHPDLNLAIFDCWRPIRVQKFMYEYAINQECISRGVDANQDINSIDMKVILETVNNFWATPSFDKATPPPHSTGGAVDLTISLVDGSFLDMGGEIDCIGPVSIPNYYADHAKSDNESLAYVWNARRLLLSQVMKKAGFSQHPNEWWHFSYGDQLWAWLNDIKSAYYGGVDEPESNFVIA